MTTETGPDAVVANKTKTILRDINLRDVKAMRLIAEGGMVIGAAELEVLGRPEVDARAPNK